MQSKYDKEKIISLRDKGYSFSQIAKEIGCCRGTVEYYCTEQSPNTKCVICTKDIYRKPGRLNEHNCCSISCRNKWFSKDKHPKWNGGVRDKNKSRLNEKKWIAERKNKAISLLGGECQKCGYKKCNAALEFHHRDPLEKDVNIKNIITHKWEIVEREIAKCDLLCANCHREVHHG